MVLNKFLSVICNFISLKGQPRLKEAPASWEVIEPNVELKLEEGLDESTAESSTGTEGEFCCVCLSTLEEEGEETSLLPCQHKFHKDCVERWFSLCKKTCPICRFSMEEDEWYGEVLTEEMVIYFSSFHAAGF